MTYDLSSNILERQFGPTTITMLRQNGTERVIQTQTVSGEMVLEISRVRFIDAGVRTFPAVHAQVVNGQSMGKAFRAAGVSFVRHTKSVSQILPPDQFAARFHAEGPMWAIEVEILVGEERMPYATILETYSPAVRWPEAPVKLTDELREAILDFNQIFGELD